jgi:uncharacterized protein YcbK (DUF882 family)
MTITFNELLHGHSIADVPIAAQQNLQELLKVMNTIRDAYGIPMVVTSGYRNTDDQARINPTARHSQHIVGNAVDILDENGILKVWINKNIPLMEQLGIYFEDFAHTPNWVHFQRVPPMSGHRFFIP